MRDLADAGHSAEQPELGRWLGCSGGAVLNVFDLHLKRIEAGELNSDHGRRVAGQTVEHRADCAFIDSPRTPREQRGTFDVTGQCPKLFPFRAIKSSRMMSIQQWLISTQVLQVRAV
jgi:hypothetical protein